jgi:hypothetical protein
MRGSLFGIASRAGRGAQDRSYAAATTAWPFWHTGRGVITGLILFALLGVALGYAVPGPAAWSALLVPIAFALLTAFVQGVDLRLFLVLLLALGVTAAAVIAGRALDRYFAERAEGQGAS